MRLIQPAVVLEGSEPRPNAAETRPAAAQSTAPAARKALEPAEAIPPWPGRLRRLHPRAAASGALIL